MAVWDKFLTDEDRRVYELSGWGGRGDLGKRPALLIVDVNYAFAGDCDEPLDASIKKWRSSCGPVAWKAIPALQRLVSGARERRIPIIYTTSLDGRPDGFERGSWAYKNPRFKEDRQTIVPGIRGTDIVKEIGPLPHDIVLRKLKASAFHGTPLLDYLIDLGIDSLLICGTVTSGCVRATVVD